uniref:VPS37 C-terminal domain-containing protein n=1 Tax=Macrostomum lignano TaxID=282301 RepID=A0A1I8FG48_9PLAT
SSRHGPPAFITEDAAAGGSDPGSNGETPRAGTRLPPLGQPLPRVSADAPVRAVRGFDPDTYLEELRGTEAKLQVVTAALKQQEAESADLLAKMSGAGRGGGGGNVGTGQEQQQQSSFDWLQVLRQEKEASIHSLKQRIDLLNFQKEAHPEPIASSNVYILM